MATTDHQPDGRKNQKEEQQLTHVGGTNPYQNSRCLIRQPRLRPVYLQTNYKGNLTYAKGKHKGEEMKAYCGKRCNDR